MSPQMLCPGIAVAALFWAPWPPGALTFITRLVAQVSVLQRLPLLSSALFFVRPPVSLSSSLPPFLLPPARPPRISVESV